MESPTFLDSFHPIPFSFLKELYYGIKKLQPCGFSEVVLDGITLRAKLQS